MDFRITGLPAEPFLPLFDMTDAELTAHDAVRQVANDRQPGYPCRVSLTDSRPGDELVLVNYEHHAVASPYRMRYAIYVRPGETQFDEVNQVPEQLRLRSLAARAFDARGMAIDVELVDGVALEATLRRQLALPETRYIHLHNAAHGCYVARVTQA